MVVFGGLIQRARQEQGLNQAQLAERAGLRQEMISKIETGQGGVRIATVCAVLTALGLEMTIAPRSQGAASAIEDIF